VRPIYQAELVNGVFGDPVIYIDLKFERRAVLFDIGDVSRLPTRKLLRISDVFVSHTHMDHFAGFDHLLRVCLGRDTGVRLYGPRNFIDQVEHKLHAYTWNLVENYASDFTITYMSWVRARAYPVRAFGAATASSASRCRKSCSRRTLCFGTSSSTYAPGPSIITGSPPMRSHSKSRRISTSGRIAWTS
jgi:ribonuclease BN (tRNA processing enzyme)